MTHKPLRPLDLRFDHLVDLLLDQAERVQPDPETPTLSELQRLDPLKALISLIDGMAEIIDQRVQEIEVQANREQYPQFWTAEDRPRGTYYTCTLTVKLQSLVQQMNEFVIRERQRTGA